MSEQESEEEEYLETRKAAAQFKIREFREEDRNFLFNSWLVSYKNTPFGRKIPDKTYYKHHHARVGEILDKDETIVLVAANPGDDDQIYGYLVAEYADQCAYIHYVYCKLPFRTFRIGASLVEYFLDELDPRTTYYTSFVPAVKHYVNKHNLYFHPYRFYGVK